MGRGKRPQRLGGLAATPSAYGLSTGWDPETREDWVRALAVADDFSGSAVELSALSLQELPGLLAFLEGDALVALADEHVSVHGPVKGLTGDWATLTAQLEALPDTVATIVMHPDTLSDDSFPYLRKLGARLVLENMDCRKEDCRTPEELARVFAALPEAGFCLDVAHVWTVDPTLALGHQLLDAYGSRLREVHVSGIEPDGKHRPTTQADLARYEPLLTRCRQVPWVFESPLVD
jgi:hypothetical protein